MRTHVAKEIHERAAAGHVREAQHHYRMAESIAALRKCMVKAEMSDMDDAGEQLDKIISEHRSMADAHSEYARQHVEAAKALHGFGSAKAAGGFDDSEDRFEKIGKIVPDGARVFDTDTPARIRAIPRAGQQPLDDFSTTAVDPDFQSFIKAE